jgi:hypothetical protein
MSDRSPGPSRDPVAAWLAKVFPHQQVLRVEIAADLRRCPVLLVDPPNKSFFGHVVELAIGLTLCDQIPYRRLLNCLEPDRATRLLVMAGYRPTADATTAYDTWRRADSVPHPARTFTAASRLAHVRCLLNDLDMRRPDVDDVARLLLRRYPRLLDNRPDEAFHARRAFRTLWSSYTSGFHAALRSYGLATAQFSLLGGCRQADFLLGTTLLELKSGRLDEDRYLDELIQQILTYVLLAHHDGRTTTHVAVYAARYQRLLRYRVQDLLVRLADTPVDLTAAGGELAALIRHGRHCRSAA